MCGVAGLINLDGDVVSPFILKNMTDAIAHRGPDGEGHWIEENVGLGHRRLSIIDLSSAGHQPMISADYRYVLSYNGEIYNFREIKKELEAEGVRFRSRTDSEVVLSALAHWKTDALLKFNGMFALALWDRKEKSLLLARDRYGIKPLYYSNNHKRFLFGSEQKAVLTHPDQENKLNKSALLEYFTFQNLFTCQTLTEGLQILPAGHFLVLDTNRKEGVKIECYWDYCFSEPKIKQKNDDYIEELQRLFKQAVNRQLVSDVELGSYLSGGIDSGSITSIASKAYPNLKTFTCGFDMSSATGIELAFDERTKAEAMSSFFKTEQYEIVLKAGDMERSLASVAQHLEEPRVGQSYPNYYAAKLASKFVKVVLSGTGGDELFGGYPWRYYRAASAQNFEEYIDQHYLYWQRLANNKTLKSLFTPIWAEVQHVWTRDIFRDVFKSHNNNLETPEDYINNSLYLEAKTFLHSLFVVEDKLSMAHGLESRVPFMDNDLVDFAMKCPVTLKINNLKKVVDLNENEPGCKQSIYFQKTNDGKQILRAAMRKYLPKVTIEASKQGFSSPDASWFKGESIDFVKGKLLDKKSPLYQFFDYQTSSELVNEHLSGKKNRRLLIWSLLYVNEIL